MADDSKPESDRPIAANDNRGPDGREHESANETRRQLEEAALTIARLIGRRIAREQFAALNGANDNSPRDVQGDEAGKE